MTRILINDLERHTRTLGGQVHEAIERVVTRGWFVLGDECASFEREFAAFCDAAHCIGVGNGTDALELSLRALEIGPGCRVGTVANAGCYATTAILQVGADPVYVDVSDADRLMDFDALRSLVEAGKLDAVVLTHLFGAMHDVVEARRIVDRAGIPLIEDCAQAHGAKRDGRVAGSVGHVGCFSFYPTKNLGGLGDGGAVVTSDPALASRLSSLRQYGWTSKYKVEMGLGRNSRLDEIQAAVLRLKLPHLDRWNERRREIARRYGENISHPRVRCPASDGAEYVAHLYVVETPDPSGLRAHLAAAGIASDVHYPIPDHRQPALAGLRDWPHLPVTERLAARVLTLPCFPEMTDEELDRVTARVNAW